ncbi:amino acid/amide ABC transporter substrate-binding protein, HAAT family [Geoalkalibacter ferrihydriticus]|nr:amino acid/amide ABC transporter substrate-binding protein, HAAT family [Geoalkalibacter ferrihydriticus]
MKRMMKSVCALIGLLLVLLLAGCHSSSSSSSYSEPVTVVKVGAVLPLDGPWSSLGESAAVALDLAVESVNYYLQEDNLQLELVVENSHSDAGGALVALQSLHAQGVRAVVGPMTSDEAAVMVGYANANDMLLVSPSSTAVSLALPDNLFRMVPNDSNQVEALIDLIKNQNFTHLLPVFLNDPYGRDFEQLMRADTSDIEVLDAIKYEVHTTHFAPVVSSIEVVADTLDPDNTAVLFIGRDSDAVQIFSSAGVSSPLADFKWFATDSIIREAAILHSPVARDFAASVELEGFTFSSEATAPVVSTMMVTGMMAAELGRTPSPSSLGVWDALWFVAEAYRLNPEADTAELIENFISVVNNAGNFSAQMTQLDDNGDMIPVRYARFVVEEGSSGIRWTLKGLFIKSINVGVLSLPVTASPTHETGEAVIGVLLPLSGANAEQGFGAQQAINLALQHANDYYQKSLGVNVNFKVEVRDTAGNPATALAQLQALHAEGIELFIGPIYSGELAAVRDYAMANDIVIISTTSTAPSLARSDDRIMRLTPDDTHQAKALSHLITAQHKEHVVMIYRDDVYGQDFVTAFSAIFEGSINSYAYAPDTTSFSTVLDQASSRVAAISEPTDTAVLVVGLDEVTSLLEELKTGSLTEVKWYGTDGISKSRTLLASPVAMAIAERIQLTCSIFDAAARTYLHFAHPVLESKLTPLLGGSSTWNEVSAYDALWLSASAFAMTGPSADSDELWAYLTNIFASSGINEMYLFNERNDQTVSHYTFYTPRETGSGPVWIATAFYRDYFFARDSLEIIGE